MNYYKIEITFFIKVFRKTDTFIKMSQSFWESEGRHLDNYLSYFEKHQDLELLSRQLKTLKYKPEFINGLIEDRRKIKMDNNLPQCEPVDEKKLISKN